MPKKPQIKTTVGEPQIQKKKSQMPKEAQKAKSDGDAQMPTRMEPDTAELLTQPPTPPENDNIQNIE